MAGIDFTTKSVPIPLIKNSGGLNSTASPVGVADNEASDLQNIDFDRFGAFKKRNGFNLLNTSAVNSGADCTGLHYFLNRQADIFIGVFEDKIYKMDSLDGTWDNITGLTQKFVGAGLNDATFGGVLSTTYAPTYKVVIDTTGTPDKFEWFKDGVSQAAGVAITGAAQTLDSGITITFAATTGHTLNEYWLGYPPVTISVGKENQWKFVTFNNAVYATNGLNLPIKIDEYAGCTNFLVPPGLTKAKFIESFENYMWLANCLVSGVKRPTRAYWSAIDNAESWDAADFIEVGLDDGDDLSGLKKLGDRMALYKEESIHVALFTGDADIPFVFKKTPAETGTVSNLSIVEAINGHFFLATDGIYFFDGFNITKLSDRISTTILDMYDQRLQYSVGCYQKSKNKYWLCISSQSSGNDTVITYDIFNNAFSIYKGISANAITSFKYINDERVYFGDYSGFCCRADVENNYSDRSSANAKVAIEGFYKTKWFDFGDVVLQKGISQSVSYFDFEDTTLSVSYSYDLNEDSTYTQLYSLNQGIAKWDSATWDEDEWVSRGGSFYRVDHKGRGRLMREIFYNNNIDQPFKINAYGMLVHYETHV